MPNWVRSYRTGRKIEATRDCLSHKYRRTRLTAGRRPHKSGTAATVGNSGWIAAPVQRGPVARSLLIHFPPGASLRLPRLLGHRAPFPTRHSTYVKRP